MSLPGIRIEYFDNPNEPQRKVFSSFLEQQNLEYEETVEFTLKVVDDASGEMVGTGSIEGAVIKCMAVDSNYRGEGISALILSALVKEQFNRGRKHIFVFTHPKNIEEISGNIFSGFNIVAKTDEIVLLEMGSIGIKDYLDDLKFKTRGIKDKYTDPIGSIVVNCNPFTLGHQYLIETAANECSFLYVFVVSEDKSFFPTNIRIKLVKEGTEHLDNVMVLEGGEYIISQATFPKYFLKEFCDISLAQARLDVTIFSDYIVPLLGITKRYVGEEPYCMVTNSYNQAMKEILIPRGVELKVVPRKEINGEAISASKVRSLISKNRIDDLAQLVPPSTSNFLRTAAAKPIIEKIKKEYDKH
ncbi:MAG: [citrate (pro-3S)-lyase] ligase [Asgard group archaeon]|nr:[citrate (pro-3S)-lyase] ligase [Asgard group archaeon]